MSQETAAPGSPPAAERRSRVRNRLLAGVALCSLAVIGAGTPAVVNGTENLSESQQLVDHAELDKRSVALSHALADERDGMVEYVAAGRTSRDGAGVTEEQRARVDRQVTEIRETAPAAVRNALKKLSRIRQEAQAGKATAQDIHEAYTGTVKTLQDVGASVARSLPARAQTSSGSSGGPANAQALPDLGRAVEQASAVRGLLRGALAGDGGQPGLTAQAQRANVREQAALADFGDAAGTRASETYAKTVTGADVTLAERYLQRLTDRPYLDAGDRGLDHERIDAALSARIDSMRGVQASFAADELKRLEQLRDDDVTGLELRIALVAGCLLIAVGVSVQTARSMARPLSVLTRGSRRLAENPVGEKPVTYSGRNDEFADVVKSLNGMRETVVTVHERAAEAEADNTYLVRSKDSLTAERDRLRGEFAALKEHVDALSGAVHGTFVNLALRTLGLVERQLGVIESLEEEESDPGRLSTLFKLDHLATRMRRYSENLLLLAGAEHATAHHSGPVPLLDVLRAAISEIERYERVELGTLPPHAQVSGFAADDLSHLVAELLDNAATFSPPDTRVQLSGWLLESGEVMLSVEDEGIGITGRRLSSLNARLSVPDGQEPPELDTAVDPQSRERRPEAGLGMGLYVVARLASRHGLRAQLRERKQGGIAAVVAVPSTLLPSRPTPVAAPTGDGVRIPAQTSPSLPGSVAEANSNALPVRRPPGAVGGGGNGPALSETPSSETPHSEPSHSEAPYAEGGAGSPSSGDTSDAPDVADAADDPMVTAAEQAIRKAGDTEGGSGSPLAPQDPAAAPTPAPAQESVPEQHGLAPGDGFAEEAARPDTGREAAPEAETHTDADADADVEDPKPRVTDKGLPKRRPHQVAAQTGPVQPRKQSANAEELRRRLGGFQRGAQHGRRDAEAETGAEENETDQPGAQSDGGTAEEART
ncbi:MAG TPA: nitrate- and nitrite sensing domain-containing protein [Streptomyces sp.]|nr:nitrate- and nitrite sensing domain-containing protein [Streptomyces sp.]